jgi:hypothetical protein
MAAVYRVIFGYCLQMERGCLPQYRSQPLTAAELAQRREQARLRHAQRLAQSGNVPHVGGMYDLFS